MVVVVCRYGLYIYGCVQCVTVCEVRSVKASVAVASGRCGKWQRHQKQNNSKTPISNAWRKAGCNLQNSEQGSGGGSVCVSVLCTGKKTNTRTPHHLRDTISHAILAYTMYWGLWKCCTAAAAAAASAHTKIVDSYYHLSFCFNLTTHYRAHGVSWFDNVSNAQWMRYRNSERVVGEDGEWRMRNE